MSCTKIETTGSQAERVLAIRLAHGLSQTDFAKVLRVGQTTISRMERGESEISGPTDIVLDLLEGPHSDLLFGDDISGLGNAKPRPRLAQSTPVTPAASCPVKDIAETVQHLVGALNAAEAEKEKDAGPTDFDARLMITQAEHRYEALWDLIAYKKDQAACMQAISPGGAAHQVALASLLVQEMWECAPELSENRENHWKSKEAHRLLQWTLNSILNVLLSLEPTPREKLGIEFYMQAEYSPFVRTALQQEAA